MTRNHSLWSRIHSKYLKSVFTKLKIFLNGPLIPRYDPFKTLHDVRFLIFLIPWSFPDCVFPDFGLEVLFYPFYQVYKCMDIFNLGKVVEFWCILNIFLNNSSEQIKDQIKISGSYRTNWSRVSRDNIEPKMGMKEFLARKITF